MCTLSPSLFTRFIPYRAIKAGAQGISMGSLSRRMIHTEDLYEEFLSPSLISRLIARYSLA